MEDSIILPAENTRSLLIRVNPRTVACSLQSNSDFTRLFEKFIPWQIAYSSLFHREGWPFASAEPKLWVLVCFGLLYLLVRIYIASAL